MCSIAEPPLFILAPLLVPVVGLLMAKGRDKDVFFWTFLAGAAIGALAAGMAVSQSWWFHLDVDAECRVLSQGPGRAWHYLVLGALAGTIPGIWARTRRQ